MQRLALADRAFARAWTGLLLWCTRMIVSLDHQVGIAQGIPSRVSPAFLASAQSRSFLPLAPHTGQSIRDCPVRQMQRSFGTGAAAIRKRSFPEQHMQCPGLAGGDSIHHSFRQPVHLEGTRPDGMSAGYSSGYAVMSRSTVMNYASRTRAVAGAQCVCSFQACVLASR